MTGFTSLPFNCRRGSRKDKDGTGDFRARQTKRLEVIETRLNIRQIRAGVGDGVVKFWYSAPMAGGQWWQNRPALLGMIDMEGVLV